MKDLALTPNSMACGHPKSPLYFGNFRGHQEQAGVCLQLLFLCSHVLNQKRNFPSFFHRRNLCTQCIDECSRLNRRLQAKMKKLNCSHVKKLTGPVVIIVLKRYISYLTKGLKVFHDLLLILSQSLHLADIYLFILFLFFSLLPLGITANS